MSLRTEPLPATNLGVTLQHESSDSLPVSLLFSVPALSSLSLFQLQSALSSLSNYPAALKELQSFSLAVAPQGIIASFSCNALTSHTETILKEIRRLIAQVLFDYQVVEPTKFVEAVNQYVYENRGHTLSKEDFLTSSVKVLSEDENLNAKLQKLIGGPILAPNYDPIEEYLAADQMAGAEVELQKSSWGTPQRVWLQNPGMTNAAAMWARPLPPARNAREALARSVACWILGGHPESRLSRALRSGQGLVYNPGSALRNVGGTQWFSINVTTHSDNCTALLDTVHDALRREGAAAISKRDIVLATRFMGAHSRKEARMATSQSSSELRRLSGQDPYGLSQATLDRSLPLPTQEEVTEAIKLMTSVTDLTLVVCSPFENPGFDGKVK